MRQTGDSGFQFPKKWICLWWQCVEFGVFRFVQRKLQLCPETGGQGRVLQVRIPKCGVVNSSAQWPIFRRVGLVIIDIIQTNWQDDGFAP